MEDYDPLKDTRKPEFPKELQNMGIDKQAITGDTEEKTDVSTEVKPETKAQEPKEVKVDEAQTTLNDDYKEVLARIDSTEQQISKLNDRIGGIVENMNNVLTQFHEKMESISNKPQAAEVPKEEPKQQTLEKKKESDDLEPGDIQIEDYFNFSNAKFN